MKKNVILSCVLLVVLSMISCVEDEQMYSCNKTINDWAKSNLSEIRSMTMSDWLLIPEVNYQRAAYVAFTPTQKLNFWIEKLNSVLQMDWDEKERKHIKEMYDAMMFDYYYKPFYAALNKLLVKYGGYARDMIEEFMYKKSSDAGIMGHMANEYKQDLKVMLNEIQRRMSSSKKFNKNKR